MKALHFIQTWSLVLLSLSPGQVTFPLWVHRIPGFKELPSSSVTPSWEEAIPWNLGTYCRDTHTHTQASALTQSCVIASGDEVGCPHTRQADKLPLKPGDQSQHLPWLVYSSPRARGAQLRGGVCVCGAYNFVGADKVIGILGLMTPRVPPGWAGPGGATIIASPGSPAGRAAGRERDLRVLQTKEKGSCDRGSEWRGAGTRERRLRPAGRAGRIGVPGVHRRQSRGRGRPRGPGSQRKGLLSPTWVPAPPLPVEEKL